MKKSILLSTLSASLLVSASANAACVSADLLLVNGHIYTGLATTATASRLAVKEGKILSLDDKTAYCPDTKQIDLQGAYVYPGFTDAHAHLKGVGYRELTLNLQEINSLKEVMDKVRAYAETTKPGDWIVGRGWIEKVWPEGRFPTRHDLDQIAKDRPIVLTRADGHALIANSYALTLAGITENTPAPDGGAISKDDTGALTGMLVDHAMELIYKHVPSPSRADDKKALATALARNVSVGWTQTQNAGGSFSDIALLKELRAEGRLKHRLYYAMDSGPEAAKLLEQGVEVDPDNWLDVRGIKLYADGALGSRGAALIDKYHDANSRGLLLTTREAALPVMIRALRKGVQIETHAIGDRANRLVLDWYQEALTAVPETERAIKDPRWRIEHAQNIQPDDQIRFKELGIIPSMQPSHAIGDLHFAPDRLGPARLANAYPWANMIRLGLKVPAGSDAPVEIGDPRIEFYAAVARKDLSGYSAKGWHPEQRVSRLDALKMLTLWPAYAAFQEEVRGTIEVGKLADVTILSKDIMTIPETEIMSADVVLTIVGGEVVYRKE
ncbi:amidohydrolase [Paremcibacter congregatus]|uniref:amidohydrolase n=1 Tax=Paremcibacter congregatus TaxID=2043170 RepID=UPI003A9219CC